MVSSATIDPDVSSNVKAVMQNTNRYVTCAVDANNNISFCSTGPMDSTFEAFCNDLPTDEPRYAIYNLAWTSSDGRNISKILFIAYIPDECKSIQ